MKGVTDLFTKRKALSEALVETKAYWWGLDAVKTALFAEKSQAQAMSLWLSSMILVTTILVNTTDRTYLHPQDHRCNQ